MRETSGESLRVPRSGIRSYAWPRSGCRRGSMCGVTLATACPHTPIGTRKLHRHDACLQPRPRPRGVGLPLKMQQTPAPFLDVVSPLSVFSPTGRVAAVASMRPHVLYPAAAVSRFVVADLSLAMQRSSLLRQQFVFPPRINISEIGSPSDRAVSKDTCVGGCGAISPPIALPPPKRPPA